VKVRTTIMIENEVLQRTKMRGVRLGRSVSSLIEMSLLRDLDEAKPSGPYRLPSFGSGGTLPGIDLSDNGQIQAILDQDDAL